MRDRVGGRGRRWKEERNNRNEGRRDDGGEWMGGEERVEKMKE